MAVRIETVFQKRKNNITQRAQKTSEGHLFHRTDMKRIIFLFLFVVTAGTVVPAQGSDMDRDAVQRALQKPVTIRWKNRDCAEALSELGNAAGCPVAVTRGLLAPSKLRKFRFQLRVENKPLQRVFDMCAATLGGVYWIDQEFGIWFGTGRDVFTGLKFRPGFFNIHGLEKKKLSLVPDLKEFFKLELLCGKKAWIRYFEKDPRVLSAGLPERSHHRMKRLLSLMSPASEPAAIPLRQNSPGTLIFQKIMARSVHFETTPMSVYAFCRLLSVKTGLCVNYNRPAFSKKNIRTIQMQSPTVPLRQALAQLDQKYGIKTARIGKDGLWLDLRTYPEWKNFSFEAAWHAVEVRAYHLAPGRSRLPGKALVHLIRENVYPQSWKTPCSAILFRQRNRSIIVMHYPRVLAAVEKFIILKTKGESNE